MAFVKADRVQETSVSVGVGPIILAGPYAATYRTFASQMAEGDTCQYLIINEDANDEWEIGEGSYSFGTLIRTTVLSSSNNDTTVTFTAGTKRVAMLPPASAMVVEDNSGNATIANDLFITNDLTVSGDANVTGNLNVDGDLVIVGNTTYNGDLDITGSLTIGTPLAVSEGGTGGTTSTGSGAVVLADSPVLVAPNLGTPAAANLSNAIALPLTTGVTGQLPIANGGTGATTAQAASQSLSTGFAVADLAALKALTARPEAVIVETGQAKGVWQWELGSSTTADDALVVNPTSGTAGRYKRIYDGKTYFKQWWNVAGDGSTNDTAAFAALESSVPGADIDLQGDTHLVTAIPTGANYFNGSWKIGSTLYPAAYKRFANPFDGQASTVARYAGTNWPCGVWYDATTQYLWRAEIVGAAHDNADGSRLEVMYSRDGGCTWIDRRTIFSSTTLQCSRAAAMGIMSSGRWGGILSVNAISTPTDRSQFFVYSDDSGATWTATDITASVPDAEHYVYGMLLPGPSGASGDWMVATYAGTSAAKLIRTTDNGTNWADSELKSDTGLPGNAQEPSIVAVPDGWIMFVRTAADTNVYATTTADFVTWGDWVDTGVPLGANPVHALYDGGRVHLSVVQRADFPGTTRGNNLLCYTGEASAVFNDPSVLGDAAPSLMYALTNKATAYIQSCRMQQDTDDLSAPWVHVLKTAEGNSTTEQTQSDVTLIRQLPGTPQAVDMARQVVQLVRNPIMSLWPPRVDSLSGFTTDRPLAANWRSQCSGATMTVTQTSLSSEQIKLFPFKPIYSMRVESSGADFAGVVQPWYGRDAIQAARTMSRGGDLVLRLYAIGTMPASLRASLSVNGSAYAAGVAFPRVPATSAWCSEVVLEPGDLPVDLSAVTTVTLTIDCGASTAAYDFQIAGVFLFPMGCAANMDFTEPFVPPLPSPYVLGRTSIGVSHTGDTNETSLGSVTVPGNSLGQMGLLRITTYWSGNNGADTKTIRVRFSTISGTAFHSQALAATVQSASLITYIRNTTTATQEGGIAAASTTGVGTSTAAIPTASVDTSSDRTIVFSGQLANGADTVALEGYVVELYPDE